MGVKKAIKSLINKLPYVRNIYQNNLEYLELKKNGFFLFVSVEDIKKREFEIWNKTNKDGIPGIDLRTDDQIKLIENFARYYNEIPFKSEKQPNIRYYYENDWYSYADGIILYSMIRYLTPQRIIEIGSGFSSAVMLDTNELFFDNQINLTFIEPYPERLYSLLNDNDIKQTSILQSDIQLVNLDNFKKLHAGDILFVDSSHVVKTGSDVNYILFEILPLLNSGVLIHFHDVFYPFEYPKEWVLEGRNWNEDYFLKAFLINNSKFEIRLFADYIQKLHREAFMSMPLSLKSTGQNLWIEKK